MTRADLTKYAWLSILAAILTISLKATAFYLTGSVGLLSDALESVVNLVASSVTLLMLIVAALPPDDEHAFGHGKAEYFASGIEGTLILVAALSIGYAASLRLFAPQPIEQVGVGIVISLAASGINFLVARILLNAGKQYRSIALEADARHLLTDVWTSIGVLVGVGIVALTGAAVLDPVIALVVAGNITWAGFQLVRRSVLGLMDTAVNPEVQRTISAILEEYKNSEKVDYHALRTRQAGTRQFISVHILVPGEWTVQRGHQLLERIEADVRRRVENAIVFTHLESLDDPASWSDIELDRFDDVHLHD